LQRLLFCYYFGGGGQSTCLALALVALVVWRSWFFLLWHCTFLCGILWHYFCASALFYVPRHFALCRDAVFWCFVLRHCFCEAASALFHSNVINAAVLCFVSVSWHCTICCILCHGILLCAVALCFVLWGIFCATALCATLAGHAAAFCVPKWAFCVCSRHCYL